MSMRPTMYADVARLTRSSAANASASAWDRRSYASLQARCAKAARPSSMSPAIARDIRTFCGLEVDPEESGPDTLLDASDAAQVVDIHGDEAPAAGRTRMHGHAWRERGRREAQPRAFGGIHPQ